MVGVNDGNKEGTYEGANHGVHEGVNQSTEGANHPTNESANQGYEGANYAIEPQEGGEYLVNFSWCLSSYTKKWITAKEVCSMLNHHL